MPTTFTHDLFGKEVYKRLPAKQRKEINEAKSLYLIGLHGPDILFYYHPLAKNRINRLGGQLHEKNASDFFCQAIVKYQENPTPQMRAYLLGFCCHFILDSVCHPYVYYFEQETGISHGEIETELDRYYLLREGKDPFTYKPSVSICPTAEGCRAISGVLGKITEKQAAKALRGMKKYTNLLVCESQKKRVLLLGALKAAGCYDSMEGQVMREEKNPRCTTSTEILCRLYEQALPQAVEALKNIDACMEGEGRLSPRFYRDFLCYGTYHTADKEIV